MTDDKLRERLLRTWGKSVLDDGTLVMPLYANSDGPAAVAELDRLEAENTRKSAIADQLAEAVELALPIIEEEREVTVSSYTVLYKGDPNFGKVADPDAVAQIGEYDAALSAGRQALATYRESVK